VIEWKTETTNRMIFPLFALNIDVEKNQQ